MSRLLCSLGTAATHVTAARVERGVRLTVRADGRTSTTVLTKEQAASLMLAFSDALEDWE